MQLSDEMVERAVAAAERGWGDGLAFASCVREGLRAAVDSIPDPASPPDRLPVPGAAVRALVDAWKAHGARALASQLEAALRADAAEMPTPGSDPARTALSAIAVSAVPNAAVVSREFTYGHARDIMRQLANGDGWARAALAHVDRIRDLESQLASVTAERDELQGAQVLNRNAIAGLKRERDEALAKLADAEHEVKDLTRYYDRYTKALTEIADYSTSPDVKPIDEKAVAYVDALHEKLVDAHNTEVELRQELAARPEPVVIDEALADHMCRRRGSFATCWDNAERAEKVLRMKEDLIAVFGGDRTSVSVPQGETAGSDVPAEANAAAHRSLDNADIANGPLEARVQWLASERDQLRAELEKTRAQLDEYLCAEREMGIAADQTGEHLPLVMVARRLSTELEMRTREIEKTRAELEARKEAERRFAHARRQHEALRAAVAVQDGPVEAVRAALAHYRDKVAGPHTRALYWAASKLLDAAALLKPAPAEAGPVRWEDQPSATNDFGELRTEFRERLRLRGEPVQHPPPVRVRCADGTPWVDPGTEPVQHPPPESAMVELAHDMPPPQHVTPEEMAQATEEGREFRRGLDRATAESAMVGQMETTLEERVERLERGNGLLWRFVERGAYWVDWDDAAREALDARKCGGA